MVNGVSVRMHQGEAGLLGPNGAGKTTCFYMMVGFITPTQGSVFIDQENISRDPMYMRAHQGCRLSSQEPSVFRKLSVEDNIKAILRWPDCRLLNKKDNLENLIEEFNLGKVRKNAGDSLSGGEHRRTEIARALAFQPQIYIAGRAFAGIDPIAVEDIQSIVEKLKRKISGSWLRIIMYRRPLSITDRAYLIFEGKILKNGSA